MSERTFTSTARFVVTGEFITRQARTLWQEGEYRKALDLLECCEGIDMNQCIAILMGRNALDGQNDDVRLIEDQWQPPDGYLSFYDVLTAAGQMPELAQRRRAEAQEIATRLARLEQQTLDWCDGDDASELAIMRPAIVRLMQGEEEADALIAEARETLRRTSEGATLAETHRGAFPDYTRQTAPRIDPLQMVAHMARTQLMLSGMDPDSVPTVDALLHRGGHIVPKVCGDMSETSGWLLPDGKYYPCGPMEHVGLAETLLEGDPSSEANSERLAEQKGWIKLSKSATGFHCTATRKPTKKQLTKLWDYAEKHGRDYEQLIAHLPK